ncbi:MAG: hypothetical protein J0H74_29905 [Chitinophagaceae bacterium]|nr:hypothetical protein [Chitinophagaceae bacterium]
MTRRTSFSGLLLLLLCSCNKSKVPAIPASPGSLSDVFEAYWNGMNNNYLYWDIDTTDWDKTYAVYKPLFAVLNDQDPADLRKAVGYFRQMSGGIIDGHFSIQFTYPLLKDSMIYPVLNRKLLAPDFHSPFPYPRADSGYLDSGYVSGGYVTTGQDRVFAMSGTIQRRCLYFYCDKFALQEAFESDRVNGVRNVLQYFFEQLNTLSPEIRSLVIDVRNNAGGNLADLNFLLGSFISKPLAFGYTRYKNGNGRLNYTPWIPAYVMPKKNSKALTLPVIVLADSYSISMAEATVMAIKAMPNSYFIGETTWGATGPISDEALYYGGPFSVYNYFSVYTSSAEFKYIDGRIYEGKGFPPDIPIPFDAGGLLNGRDRQLEKALSLVQ